MKNILFLVSCLVLVSIGCSNDSASNDTVKTPPSASEQIKSGAVNTAISTETSVEVPQWVADILKANPEETRAMKCVFKGKNLYLINTCISCPNPLTEVFDDNQVLVCRIGGPDMKITCDKNEFGAEGKRDCQPVLINGQ